MKLNFKAAFPKEQNNLPLLKDVLSKGGFVKPAPGARELIQHPEFLYYW